MPIGAYLKVRDAMHERKRERIVRCRDCKHANKGGTLCNFFASWVPVAGGDEYEDMPADVEPDGFCKWGKRSNDK